MTSFQGGTATPPPVNVVELGADTDLDPETPGSKTILSDPSETESNGSYVNANREPNGYYAFNENSEGTSPCTRSLCAAGNSHYIGNREPRKVPE